MHAAAPEADAEIEALVEAREVARRARDWAEADRLRDELTDRGIVVAERVPLVVGVGAFNEGYLETKRDRMGHTLDSVLDHDRLDAGISGLALDAGIAGATTKE